jgi:hypothetical protein
MYGPYFHPSTAPLGKMQSGELNYCGDGQKQLLKLCYIKISFTLWKEAILHLNLFRFQNANTPTFKFLLAIILVQSTMDDGYWQHFEF